MNTVLFEYDAFLVVSERPEGGHLCMHHVVRGDMY